MTCLELFGSYGNAIDQWPVWAKIFNELNNVLLASYSALNPLAYCGELIFKTSSKTFKGCFAQKKTPQKRNGVLNSEYSAMKSVGITLGGPDPLVIQLEELDEQSRLMCGLSKSS